MHRRTPTILLSLLAFLLVASSTASAHPQGAHADYVVDVLGSSGRKLPSYHHRGQTFVLGSYGQRYVIRVRNQTGRRIEAVVTVDGRDVISGRQGDYTRERGYVIGAYDSVRIDGFRRSHDTVAAFRFTDPSDAYSSRMGTPQHVGVIGVAVFPERVRPVPRPYPHPRRHPRRGGAYDYDDSLGGMDGSSSGSHWRKSAPASAAPAPEAAAEAEERSRGASARRDNLGTRYGEDRHSQSYDVRFRRASAHHPAAVISLRYDDREGLVSRGIDLHPRPRPVVRRPEPNPFPYNRFAPSPY